MLTRDFACHPYVYYINYSNTTKNYILFIDVLASRRKPSSGLTSSVGRQYVKACPIRGSIGSSPHVVCLPDPYGLPYEPASFVGFSINHLGVLPVDSPCKHDQWMQILAALVFSALVYIPVMPFTSLWCSFTLAPRGLPVSPMLTRSQFLHDIL